MKRSNKPLTLDLLGSLEPSTTFRQSAATIAYFAPIPGPDAGAVDHAKHRLVLVSTMFLLVFTVFVLRLVDVSLLSGSDDATEDRRRYTAASGLLHHQRADVVDRHGVLLATNVTTASVYANPRQILDVEEAVAAIRAVFPDLNDGLLTSRLDSDRSFVWIRRNITPAQQYALHVKGVPGVYFP